MFDNQIIGDRGNNLLTGTAETDLIRGLKGDDTLIGKQGNDLLLGGRGNDTLNGTNPNSRNPGTGEIDTLDGARGADLFILGDAANVYYQGFGSSDYALIQNFGNNDTIQLKGKAEDYILKNDILVNEKPGTGIIVEETDELIGFVEDIDHLSLDNNQFDFIELPSFDKLYVFSDSLSDPGNIFNATIATQPFDALFGLDIPITPPSPPYFEGRFSNGLVWVEQLAAELELDITPSTELSVLFPGSKINFPLTINFDNGLNLEVSPYFNGNTTKQSVNFAFGGAQTGENGSGEFGDLIPGIQQQVEWFIDDHQLLDKTADSDALYVISGGRNDYTDLSINPEDVVSNIESEIQSLYDIGARDFLVSNLVDLGQLPATPSELADSFTKKTEIHNNILEETVNELNDSLTGADIVILDLNFLFDDVLENPSDYDLTNVSAPYLDPVTLMPSANADVDEYLFYDEVHPTVVGHDILSDFTLATLAAEF